MCLVLIVACYVVLSLEGVLFCDGRLRGLNLGKGEVRRERLRREEGGKLQLQYGI